MNNQTMTRVETDDLPAIAGGTPAKTVPFGREERYGQAELRQLEEALAQGTLFYAHGKKVRELEEAFAAKNGVRHAVACSSGTAAIHAALIAVGVSPGDEVIVAPITDMGSLIPILFQGAIPVFADLDPRTATLLPEAVEAAVTPRTRAVLAVHLGGNACDLRALSTICERHGLILIEDCAQALGCTYEGRPIGTWGRIGCFSLNEFKHISCGDGGITLTDDDALAERLRLATDKAYNRRPDAATRNPTFLAGAYRMTELQGAVALAQLGKLDSIVARRRDWCGALTEELRHLPGFVVPEPTPGCDPSWWFYLFQVEPDILNADADTVIAALRAEGLPVGAHYIGVCVYEYPIFAAHSAFAHSAHPFAARPYCHGLCPNAERILDQCLQLSINEAYTKTDLEETIRAFRRVHAHFATRRSTPSP
jgi:dTDP-4-amino-4,6-dideoxygalactose transaminase